MSWREAVAVGLASATILVVAGLALANQPTNVLAWMAGVVLVPIGLWGLVIAATALRRRG